MSDHALSPRWTFWLDLVITVLAFSLIEVVARPIRYDIDPLALTWWRFALAAAFLLPIAAWQGRFRAVHLEGRDWLVLGGLGVLNVVVAMGAHAVCINHARASTAAILIASNPLATNLIASWWLGEKLDGRRWLALVTGLAGVVLVASRATSGGDDTPLGIVAGIGGLVGFALYTVLSKGTVARFGGMFVTVVSFTLAVLIDLPLLLGLGVPIWPAADLWPRLLVLGLIVSGLGYLTFFRVLAAWPAGKTSLLFFAKPPVAVLLAWAMLGETPNIQVVAGSLLVMAGLAGDWFAAAPTTDR